MYCSSCGEPLSTRSAYCPSCGAAQIEPPRESTSAFKSFWIAMALIFFFPLGLILMWTSSDWDSDVKWAISGIFFPPLWMRFLWKLPWLPYAALALLAVLMANNVLAHGFSVVAAVAILAVTAVWLALLRPQTRPRRTGRPSSTLESDIRAKLAHCHDLIAEIESTVALDLMPATAPLRQLYARALEERAEGQRLLDAADSPFELRRADRQLDAALRDLRTVSRGLTE